jgi:hypothetical protein
MIGGVSRVWVREGLFGGPALVFMSYVMLVCVRVCGVHVHLMTMGVIFT